MKRIAGSISCFLVIVSLLGLSIAEAENAQWIYLSGGTEYEGFSYSPQSIMQVAPEVFSVWTKVTRADESQGKVLKEIDCTNKIVRDVQMIIERRNTVVSDHHLREAWREVVSGTPVGELFSVVCRTKAPEGFPKWDREDR